MRQVGLAFDIYYDYLLKAGIKKENVIKINLETKKNASLRNADALYDYIVKQISGDNRYYIYIYHSPRRYSQDDIE